MNEHSVPSLAPRYFLGIDAGGSNCRARLTDANAAVLGEGKAGAANAGLGRDAMREALLGAADAAFQAAGLSLETAGPETHAGMGIAGLSRAGVRDWLMEAGLPFARLQLETDSTIANLGAHRGKDGAILILGTGSIGHIIEGGVSRTIGGYGFPISDEGSGAALGLSAMRHALRALDGRTVKTPLSNAVTGRFDHDPVKAIAWMDKAHPHDYAEFAPLVMDFADSDDAIARSIVENATRHVETFIATIFEHGAPRCALMGGLAHRFLPWMRMRTLARLTPALGDAMEGALHLAGAPIFAD